MPYQPPPFDFTHFTPDMQDQDPISLDSAVPSLEEQWKATDNLEVNVLDSSIYSFMQGLDPPHMNATVDPLLNFNQQQSSSHLLATQALAHLAQSQSESRAPSNEDDYIYNFLNLEHDGCTENDYGVNSDFNDEYQSMVSLDEVQAPLDPEIASPVCSKNSDGWGKRKSEVQMEIYEPLLPPKQGVKINTGSLMRPAKRKKS